MAASYFTVRNGTGTWASLNVTGGSRPVRISVPAGTSIVKCLHGVIVPESKEVECLPFSRALGRLCASVGRRFGLNDRQSGVGRGIEIVAVSPASFWSLRSARKLSVRTVRPIEPSLSSTTEQCEVFICSDHADPAADRLCSIISGFGWKVTRVDISDQENDPVREFQKQCSLSGIVLSHILSGGQLKNQNSLFIDFRKNSLSAQAKDFVFSTIRDVPEHLFRAVANRHCDFAYFCFVSGGRNRHDDVGLMEEFGISASDLPPKRPFGFLLLKPRAAVRATELAATVALSEDTARIRRLTSADEQMLRIFALTGLVDGEVASHSLNESHPVRIMPEIVRGVPDLVGKDVAFFVAVSKRGEVAPSAQVLLEKLRDAGRFVVALLISVDGSRPSAHALPTADVLLVRQNDGYDFGAWASMVRLMPNVVNSTSLLIINDSIFGPKSSFIDVLRSCESKNYDLIGMTDSHQHEWHLQSYFLYFKKAALEMPVFREFWDSVRSYCTKEWVVRMYELRLATIFRAAGAKVGVLFPSQDCKSENPTIDGWEDLIERGVPVVKVQLLREAAKCGGEAVFARLKREGFDVENAQDTLTWGR